MTDIKIETLYKRLENCDICPWNCHVNRFKTEEGTCGMGARLKIASYGPHYGEEPELVGYSASGTIFFSGCNLLCDFCQNYDISHLKAGTYIDETELTNIILKLQKSGAANINLVTPTQFSPQIIKSLIQAKKLGLNIPVVYNSGGYDKVETLKYWDGIVDIYMPDLKFKDPRKSRQYTSSADYFEFASKAIPEMHRQVGDLIIENGVAKRGLLIRHLILPENQSDTKEIIDFIADNIGIDTYLNLLEQYRPCYKASEHDLLCRRIIKDEYEESVLYAKQKGFYRPEYVFRQLF